MSEHPMIYVKTNKPGADVCCIAAHRDAITRRFLPDGEMEIMWINKNPELAELWDWHRLSWDATMLDALANEYEEPNTELTPELAVAH